jgi:hypothetical protein
MTPGEDTALGLLEKCCELITSAHLHRCEGGLGLLQDIFPKVIASPLDSSLPVYQGRPDPQLAVLAYKRFEHAIDSLPRPTVIMCKSSARASAVLAAYQAVKGNWSKDHTLLHSKEKGQ